MEMDKADARDVTAKLAARAATLTSEVILTQMEDARENWDVEAAHGDADDLLCLLILHITGGTPYAAVGTAIVEAYQRLSKWYS